MTLETPQFAIYMCRLGEYTRKEWIVLTLVSELDVVFDRFGHYLGLLLFG